MHTLLTKREKEIFHLLALNFSTKEISNQLGISEKTVRNHISNVICKLGVQSRLQALLELVKLGEIDL
ncbi:MAG: LuxR C-terminal-related transcriptional regulator [Erysipelotrichaceae bacterium]|nr:LuxR C-terminal-related transcriptional regulator [Erysipelotrichaceae bacterium]